MSCSSCSNNSSGVPNGCKSNGSCGNGGCDKMSVFDWLSDVAVPTGRSVFDVVEISFKNGRKGFFRNEKNIQVFKGDSVVVEASPGHDVGVVSLTGELVKHQMNRKNIRMAPHEMRKIYRKTTEVDFEKWKAARDKEYETMHEARELIVKLKLNMKLGDVEYQGDGNKATFYYTADQRVDFRELIKMMADQFRIKIEMRQIGSRQEAGRLGGIGSCGRELCCSTWMTDFRSVSTGAARYQQLSLNPQKLAGQCGKLKCCLNFELDQYAEALKAFPDTRKPLETANGTAVHIKTDVFKKLMWYLVRGERNSSIICLSVDRVFELIELNKKGTKIQNITEYVQVEEPKNEIEYSNLDDQDDLTRFDSKFSSKNKKNKSRNKKKNPNRGPKPEGDKTVQNQKGPEANNTKKPNKRRNKNFKKKNTPGDGNGPAAPKKDA